MKSAIRGCVLAGRVHLVYVYFGVRGQFHLIPISGPVSSILPPSWTFQIVDAPAVVV